MTHRAFLSSLLVVLLVPEWALLGQDTTPRVPLSYEQVLAGRRSYSPVLSRTSRWAPDGKNLLNGAGETVEPITGILASPETAIEEKAPAPAARGPRGRRGASRADASSGFRTALESALGSTVPAAVYSSKAVLSTLPRMPEKRSGYTEADDHSAALAVNDGTLWFLPKDGEAKKLEGDGAALRFIKVAPGGRHLSYIKDFNLCLRHVGSGEELQLTTDGGEDTFYGELDWVYQEEVYGRSTFDATWWAPGGRHLAFLRIDEKAVQTFDVVDHIPFRQEVERIKYPKAGDGNPIATLHVASAEAGKTTRVDLSMYKDEDEILIVRVGWTPSGDRIVFQVQDREQTWLDLNFADPSTGSVTRAIHESSKSWVNVLEGPRWLKDGSFLWESERTGYKHLYRTTADGKSKALTAGDWQVGTVHTVDEDRGEIVFTATKDEAIDTNWYRVGLDGQGFLRLTTGRGTHAITFNNDRSLFLDTVEAIDNPGEQRLCKADGTVVRVLAKATLPVAAARHGFSQPELVSVPARDGYPLDVVVTNPFAVTNPLVVDPARKYPLWIDTYSGPHAPSVHNRWSGDAMAQFFAQEGIMSLQVNVRSASGRGQKDHETCYEHFGAQELKDIEDAVAWAVKNRAADSDRVGITGWSYGGFMAAYALTHSTAFRLGIAGAGVYDWRDYDTIYTERYMKTPQHNEAGYAGSSCVQAAKNLHGHLLIIHGTTDDNVHVQNAIQFIYALQKAGKQFDLMLYPKSRHGISEPGLAKHLADLRWKTIREHL